MKKKNIKEALRTIFNEKGIMSEIDALGKEIGIKLSIDDFGNDIEDYIADALFDLMPKEPPVQPSPLRNKVSLIGKLGAQPEYLEFDSGRKMARFTIATKEDFKNEEGEWQTNTQWHIVSAWGKTAELVRNLLHKGMDVMIEGKLITNSYETPQGEKRYGTTVELREFLILTNKSK